MYMLNNFKWYRKLRGGTWYLIEYKYRDTHWFDHVETNWYKAIDAIKYEVKYNAKILKQENYEN